MNINEPKREYKNAIVVQLGSEQALNSLFYINQ